MARGRNSLCFCFWLSSKSFYYSSEDIIDKSDCFPGRHDVDSQHKGGTAHGQGYFYISIPEFRVYHQQKKSVLQLTHCLEFFRGGNRFHDNDSEITRGESDKIEAAVSKYVGTRQSYYQGPGTGNREAFSSAVAVFPAPIQYRFL